MIEDSQVRRRSTVFFKQHEGVPLKARQIVFWNCRVLVAVGEQGEGRRTLCAVDGGEGFFGLSNSSLLSYREKKCQTGL